MMRWRGRSLFWTFAGAFLAVVVVATLLQAIALYTVFTPALREILRGDARALARRVVTELTSLAAVPEHVDDRAIIDALRRHATTPEEFVLVFEFTDGRTLGLGRGGGFGRGRQRALDEGGPPGGPGRFRQMEPLVREPLVIGGETVGEVVALARPPRFALIPRGMPVRIMVFLPVALIVAAAAGLLLLRIVVRRVRRLEDLAIRVAAGDLDARLDNPGHDELGRLGHQLNSMTKSLARARDRIDAEERQRRQLLADVSHELGTPLTSIRGCAETLLNPAVELSDADRSQYLEGIVEESGRIELLVRDLFDLTRLEAGAVEMAPEPIDIVDLCRRTMARFRGLGVAPDTDLVFESDVERLTVHADGRRMEQVLDNVITNAIRHAPAASRLTVALKQKEQDESHVAEICVSDDGPGFDPDDLPHVFDRFYRGDVSRATEGTGLGLAIVREIVRRHGGTASARNGPTGGAEILITLPAEDA